MQKTPHAIFSVCSVEMKSDRLNCDENTTEETPLTRIICPDAPDLSDLFEDPLVNPRVGEEFQVGIPPMITRSEYIKLSMDPTDSNAIVDVSHFFQIGLPVPIMRIDDEMVNIEDQGQGILGNSDGAVNTGKSVECRKGKECQISIGKKVSEVDASEMDVEFHRRKKSKPSNIELKTAGRTNVERQCKSTPYSLVPGSLGQPWSDAEEDNFLLGLYIFGKNLSQIKRFLGNKEMGDILSFYYGKFYRSKECLRWLDCRKAKNKKCVSGRKLFNGWRHRELLTRLLSRVPENSQSTLRKVSKSYTDKRTSFESYIIRLKTTVGIRALVESVGIGKGKEDLTSLAMEPVKINQVLPARPTLPTGKACSALTPSEIIEFLTGGFRLSKARCNDIFWEAVWPRLLARGWHSEQPDNPGCYLSSTDYLVFLTPGVKKFSKGKLVKGNHYFDSISDILNKVVSEPKLLELEDEFSNNRSNDQWVQVELSDQDDPSDHQTDYLKPCVSNCNSENMEFLVVDSSLLHGGKSSKAGELRNLPDQCKVVSELTGLSSKNEGHLLEQFTDEYELNDANMTFSGEKEISMAEHKEEVFDTGDPTSMKFMVVDTSSVHGEKISKVRAMRYYPVESKITPDMKYFSIEDKMNSSNDSQDEHEPDAVEMLVNVDPDTSDSLLDGNHELIDISSDDTSKDSAKSTKNQSQRIIKCQPGRRAKHDNSDHLDPLTKRRRLPARAKTETSRADNFLVGQRSKEVGSGRKSNSPNAGKSDDSCLHGNKHNPVLSGTSADMNPRRHSTRNRPLTSKALEALACGYLKNKREQKSKEVQTQQTPFSAPSCRARTRPKASSKCAGAETGTVELKKVIR